MLPASFLSVPDLAARWSVSEDHVRGLIRRGELRAVDLAVRVGRRHKPRYRISLAEVEALEQRRAVGPAVKVERRKRLNVPRYV